MTRAVIGEPTTRVKTSKLDVDPKCCWTRRLSTKRLSSSRDTSKTLDDFEPTMNNQQIEAPESALTMETSSGADLNHKRLKSTKTKRKHVISKTSLLVGGKVYLRYLVQLALLLSVQLTHSAVSGQTSQQGSESRGKLIKNIGRIVFVVSNRPREAQSDLDREQEICVIVSSSSNLN